MSLRGRFKRLVVRARKPVDHAVDWVMVDRRFHADTRGRIGLDELGLADPTRVFYVPVAWSVLRHLLRLVSAGPDDVFVDFGSGKGRAVLMAATMRPFKRVVGVELSEELNSVARANVDRNRARLKAREVELVTSDALRWPIPPDMTIAYFYAPFIGEVFENVIERLVESVDQHPRRVHVLYVSPRDEHVLMRTGRFRCVYRMKTRFCAVYVLE